MENTGLYLKIFGYSDKLIEVQQNGMHYNEIDCLGYDVIFEFTDRTKIRFHYGKNNDTLGIWSIIVLNQGEAKQCLTICNDENAEIHSDVFEIKAKIWTIERV